jgi:hypothetical protein
LHRPVLIDYIRWLESNGKNSREFTLNNFLRIFESGCDPFALRVRMLERARGGIFRADDGGKEVVEACLKNGDLDAKALVAECKVFGSRGFEKDHSGAKPLIMEVIKRGDPKGWAAMRVARLWDHIHFSNEEALIYEKWLVVCARAGNFMAMTQLVGSGRVPTKQERGKYIKIATDSAEVRGRPGMLYALNKSGASLEEVGKAAMRTIGSGIEGVVELGGLIGRVRDGKGMMRDPVSARALSLLDSVGQHLRAQEGVKGVPDIISGSRFRKDV